MPSLRRSLPPQLRAYHRINVSAVNGRGRRCLVTRRSKAKITRVGHGEKIGEEGVGSHQDGQQGFDYQVPQGRPEAKDDPNRVHHSLLGPTPSSLSDRRRGKNISGVGPFGRALSIRASTHTSHATNNAMVAICEER